MNRLSSFQMYQCCLFLAVLAIPAVLVIAAGGAAQQTSAANQQQTAGPTSLKVQLRELQAKVARLEAALKQAHQGSESSSSQNMSMDSMGAGPAMSQMKMDGMKKGKGENRGMESMSGQGMGGMGKKSGGMKAMGMMGTGMKMMGKMKGMGQMQMPSSLPGFPGASHIYHIGAASFFLDHAEHISLTSAQQTVLNGIKEKTLLEQATFERRIAEAEQTLWVLTSADSPDAAKLEDKVRDIERMGGDKRIAFIRAVGQAAGELTESQRMTLVGMLPPEHKTAADSR